jgi:hypothetical protein
MAESLCVYAKTPQNVLLFFLSRYHTQPRVRSVVVLTGFLFLVVFPLLLFSLAVALLGLEFVFPELVGGVVVHIGKHDFEDIRVPGYWLAFDALLDVLLRC